MSLPQLSDSDTLLAFLLAVLIDKGGIAQFSSDDLAEAAYRVAGKRVTVVHRDLPNEAIGIRLLD